MNKELISTLEDLEKLVFSFTNMDSYEQLIETIKLQIDLVAKIDTTGLYLFDEVENKLKLFYAKGFSPEEIELAERTAMDRHPGHVFKTGEILWINDQLKEHNVYSIDTLKKSLTRSRLYVPVKSRQQIIGAFGIQSETPNAFSDKHVAILKVFAALAGDAYSSIKKNLLIKKQNEENETLSILAKTTSNNVIYTDSEGKITWVNKHFEDSTGYFLSEIIGKKPGSFLCGEATEPEKSNELRKAIREKTSCSLVITNYKKNGELFKVAVQLNPVFNKEGDLLNFVSIQQDVTIAEMQEKELMRNRNEIQFNLEKIAKAEVKYRTLLQNSNELITSLDGNGTFLFVNNAWLSKMNYEWNEVIGTNIFNYIHADWQSHCINIFQSMQVNKVDSLPVSYTLVSKDGNKVQVEGNVFCKFHNEQLVSVDSFFNDVTEIKKAEQKISESNNLIQNIYAASIDAVIIVDNDGMILKWDTKAKALFGWNEAEVMGLRFSELIIPERSRHFYENGVVQFYKSTKDVEFGKSIDLVGLKKNGIEFDVSVSVTPSKLNNKGCFIGFVRDNSFRKKAEIELRENAEKLERVMSSLSETFWGRKLPNGNLEYISKSAVDLYGYPLIEWYQNENLWSDVIHPDDKEWVMKESASLFAIGETTLEYRIITAEEKIKWVLSFTRIVKNELGIPVLMTGLSRDISDKKSVETELLNVQKAIDKSAIVSVTDLNGDIIYVNDKFCEVSKFSREELLGSNSRLLSSGGHSNEFFENLWATVASGNIWEGEIKNKAKDGSIFYLQATIVPSLQDGKPYQYICIFYNSTEQVNIKLAIDEQKQFYETILNNIPGNVAVFDIHGNYIFINPNTIKDPDLRQWLIGKNNYDYCKYRGISNDLAIEREQQFKLLIENGKQFSSVEKRKGKKGEDSFMNSSLILHEYKGEQLIIAYAIDITDIKKAEAKNIELELFYENILNNIPIDIAVFDSQHKYLFINKEAIADDDLRSWMIGKDDFDYANFKGVSTDFAAKRRAEFDSVMDSDKVAFWLDEQKNSKGETRFKERRFHSYDNRKFVVGYAVDVTLFKQNELEKEKITADVIQRNKDLEQFSYIVSHNLRLPVANIMGFADILGNDDIDEVNRQQFLKALLVSTKKLEEVIVDLNFVLQIRRELSERKEVVLFSSMVESVCDSIQETIKKSKVKFITDFTEVNDMLAIKSYMYSIFYNLITNSIKYSQINIPLVIEIKSSLIDRKLVLLFKDNGSGIDLSKNKELVFGLYKRFHSKIEGKGMGLYMVKTQVEALNGTIHIDSAINKGTEFVIEFELD